MDTGTEPDRMKLVADRHEFLTRLADRPADKPALVADLGASRSTVDRAIRELTEANLVERGEEGYVTTTFGQLAAERYRAFLEDEQAVLSAEGALAALPHDADLPAELLAEGEVTTAPDEPYSLYEPVVAAIRRADDVDALLPRLGDTRPLRLCRARLLDGNLSGGVVAASSVADRLAEEFPALAADLGAEPAFDLRQGECPPFELFLVHGGDERTVFVLTADESGAVGAVRSTAGAVVDWAEGVLAAAGAESEAVAVPSVEDAPTPLSDTADRLRADGFERLGEHAFAGRTPGDPATAWQTGPDLTDVYYGYAFDRRTRPDSGEDRPVARALVDRLAADEDLAVVGPPGDGKTTTCRAVACRWVERGLGPVFYRRSRAREGFDAPSRIADIAAEGDGHTLVVVEDSVGDVGQAALALRRELPADADVTILLEARKEEWRKLPGELTDARLRTVLRDVSEYRLPAVDAATCERAVEAFEAATGRRVSTAPEALLERVREGDAGGMYLLSYLLVAHSGGAPWRTGDRAPTGLDTDVRAAHDAIVDAADRDTVLTVGTLVGALVAAGARITPAQVHTVATAQVADDADPVAAHGAVADALDALEGRLLFDGDRGYRSQHPYWAVRFLETLMDRESRSAISAFGRGLSALLTAVDDPGRRERVERWLGDGCSKLKALSDDPDTIVRDVFDLATEHSSLAPLFGEQALSTADLPDDCSPVTELHCLRDRMLGWYGHGDLERAEAAAETLAERARLLDVPADARDRFLARSLVNRGELAEQRGEMDVATEYLERALDPAEACGNDRILVVTRNSLAWVAIQTDRFDDAAAHIEAALAIGEDLPPMSARATTLYYRAVLARRRGDLAAAEEWLQRTLSMDQEIGNDSGIASTLNELGIVAENRGALDRAEDYYRRCIERRRETADRPSLAKNVYNLGDLLAKRGDLDGATDCLDRALDIAEELGMDRFRGNVYGGYGRVALAREDYDEAADHFRRSRDIHREHDHEAGAAETLAKLGEVAQERGAVETALDRYDRAAATLADLDAVGKALETLERRVDLLADQGRQDDAAACCDRAADLAAAAGLDDWYEQFRTRRSDFVAPADD